MKIYRTPQTKMSARINKIPFRGDSILKAAIIANTKNTAAMVYKNICKDAL
ncbi:hypothetical protein ACXZ1K_14585 [Pedobacter sp. PWIIR3]